MRICKNRIYLQAVTMPSETVRKRLLGARVWRARVAAGLRQADICAVLDIDQGGVSRLEQGHRGLRADEVVALAKRLRTSGEELAGPLRAEEEALVPLLEDDINLNHPLLPRRSPFRRGD
jgi:transcriptional regulator with XRE-family HTH domain